ncbi:hypothetical protein ABW20_dc0107550 [Dactylellina cionopaga]|nr:hypothetical protein ABW20_dc0107550 [Dactylellina cionopaga]
MGTSFALLAPEAAKYHDIDTNYNCQVHLEDLNSSADIFRVSKSALRLASPVLSKMIDPKSPWTKKSDSEGDVIKITLHDDDPEALEILFTLMHFKQEGIPKQLDLHQMFQLALVCDKYDCVNVAKALIHDVAADLREAEAQSFWDGFYQYSYYMQPENETGEADEKDHNGLHGRDKPAIAKMLLYVSFVFNLENIFSKAYKTYLMIWQPRRWSNEPDHVIGGPTCLPDRLYRKLHREIDSALEIEEPQLADFKTSLGVKRKLWVFEEDEMGDEKEDNFEDTTEEEEE